MCLNYAGDHRIFNSHDERQHVPVGVTTLDGFFRNKNYGIDLIKIGIFGAGIAVLQGMPYLIAKNQKLKIITEFTPLGLKESGSSPEEYLNRWLEQGFELHHINDVKQRIEPVDASLSTKIRKIEKHTRLFCKKIDISIFSFEIPQSLDTKVRT